MPRRPNRRHSGHGCDEVDGNSVHRLLWCLDRPQIAVADGQLIIFPKLVAVLALTFFFFFQEFSLAAEMDAVQSCQYTVAGPT